MLKSLTRKKRNLQNFMENLEEKGTFAWKKKTRKSALPSMNSETHLEFCDWTSLLRVHAGTKEICLEVQPGALNLLDEKSFQPWPVLICSSILTNLKTSSNQGRAVPGWFQVIKKKHKWPQGKENLLNWEGWLISSSFPSNLVFLGGCWRALSKCSAGPGFGMKSAGTGAPAPG